MGDNTDSRAPQAAPLSAERLRAAFDRMLAPNPKTSPEVDAEAEAAPTPTGILEALLFARGRADERLRLAEVAALVPSLGVSELRRSVDRLNSEYESAGSPIEVGCTGDEASLGLRSGFEAVGDRLVGSARPAQLRGKALEALAIVAYRQPITLAQATAICGRQVKEQLRRLQRHGLVGVKKGETESDPARFVTTDRFLMTAGIESTEKLPRSEEFSD